MPAKYALTASRVLQVAIFLLGGFCALSARDGQWGYALMYVLLAIVCYFILQLEVRIETEEEDR